MRVCGDPNHRQHLDRHDAPSVHVCLYWSAAVQGTLVSVMPVSHSWGGVTVSDDVAPHTPAVIKRCSSPLVNVTGQILQLHR